VCVCVNVVKVKNIFFHDEEIDDEKKCGFTGGRFRSYDLWVVIHNHPQNVPQVV
jgi:hypothetical protein